MRETLLKNIESYDELLEMVESTKILLKGFYVTEDSSEQDFIRAPNEMRWSFLAITKVVSHPVMQKLARDIRKVSLDFSLIKKYACIFLVVEFKTKDLLPEKLDADCSQMLLSLFTTLDDEVNSVVNREKVVDVIPNINLRDSFALAFKDSLSFKNEEKP